MFFFFYKLLCFSRSCKEKDGSPCVNRRKVPPETPKQLFPAGTRLTRSRSRKVCPEIVPQEELPKPGGANATDVPSDNKSEKSSDTTKIADLPPKDLHEIDDEGIAHGCSADGTPWAVKVNIAPYNSV